MIKNPIFSKDLSKVYDSLAQQDYYSMFTDSILAQIEANGGFHSKSFYELGCGNGDLISLIRSKGMGEGRYYASDISEFQIDIAKKKYKELDITFLVKDGFVVDKLSQGPFDFVVSSYMLHFIPKKEVLDKVCQNFYENTKEGGTAIILDITHDYRYSKKKMQTLLEWTKYRYEPGVPEGESPKAWSYVPGYIHQDDGKVLEVKHTVVKGAEIMEGLKKAGFKDVQKKEFVYHSKAVNELWGPEGFDHHLIVAKK